MFIKKFLIIGSMFLVMSGVTEAKEEYKDLILNSRDFFGEMAIFKIPKDFNTQPGQAYETRAWYSFDKKSKDGTLTDNINIIATKGIIIPKNHETYIVNLVTQATNSCSDTFSTFNLPETNVVGVVSSSAVIKCGKTGGIFGRKLRCSTIAIRTFEKDGIFYELTWTKYGAPDNKPLSNEDKDRTIEELNIITPFAFCKNSEDTKEAFIECMKKN